MKTRWTAAEIGTNNKPVILIDPAQYSKFTNYREFTHDAACKHAQELRTNNPTKHYMVTETYQPPNQQWTQAQWNEYMNA